jgi:cytochrome c oxidase cbb3-type subunit 3
LGEDRAVAEKEKDAISGVETTGHEWDGIKELNNPLPKWWIYVLYATIIWAIGYWIAMPAWLTISGYTKGVLGYSQRDRVATSIAEAQAGQAELRQAIAESDPAAIIDDSGLLEFALAGGASAFGDNCAPCHGRGAEGAIGYPNLNDDVWIWGGTPEDIHVTLKVGIRAGHEETRESEMPAFGRDQILSRAEINDVAEYVLSLSGAGEDATAAERGTLLFADNCAACHGEAGEGDQSLGAPNLADAIWLYGGDKASVVASISNSRAGVMPYWEGRLDDVTIKQLVVYVHSLGGGQ